MKRLLSIITAMMTASAAWSATVVNFGELQLLTAPEAGLPPELDVEGNFAYAINFNGAEGIDLPVGDAVFVTDDPAPDGVTSTWARALTIGALPFLNDLNLEEVMSVGRESEAEGNVDLDPNWLEAHLAVEVGARYKLQILFYGNQDETRIFDIEIEGKGAVDETSSLGPIGEDELTPVYGGSSFVTYTYEFVALDDTLDIRLGRIFGQFTAGGVQRDPIWQGLTLETLVPATDDGDGDGMPDAWEELFGLDPATDDAAGDLDEDGVSNGDEFTNFTDPTKKDTDDDGLEDNVETNTGTFVDANDTGSDPNNADTDADGLKDGAEIAANANPLIRDSDEDGFTDGREVLLGFDPSDGDSFPPANAFALSAFFDFDDPTDPGLTADFVTKDAAEPITGTVLNGAAYSAPGEGRTGADDDYAMFFPGNGSMVIIENAEFLNAGAVDDSMAIGYWQKLSQVSNMFSLFGETTSIGRNRGVSLHTPWSNGVIYFDHAGCCAGGVQRINAGIGTFEDDYPDFFLDWHYFVFQKNGAQKQIWIDGKLFLEGQGTAPWPGDFFQAILGSENLGGNSMIGYLDEFTVFENALTEGEIGLLGGRGFRPDQIPPVDLDTDEDGLTDIDELLFGDDPRTPDDANDGLDPNNPDDADMDADGDGISNKDEILVTLTDPFNEDSDGDGLTDGEEVNDRGTNPLLVDTDGDGLSDFREINETGTDPTVADGDMDGYNDGLEIALESDPGDANSVPVTPGERNLIAFWDFNDGSDDGSVSSDLIHGIPATFEGESFFTFDAEGRTLEPGDRGIDLTLTGNDRFVNVADGVILNAGALTDTLTISLWQQTFEVANSSGFWGVSPSSGSGNRGIQAHLPWSNENIFFDHSGCCGAGTQRINAHINTFANFDTWDWVQWHNYVFVKNGPIKQIWIDGVLFLEGGGTMPLPTDFTRLIIGAGFNGDTPENAIVGYIDEFAVFASALSPDEIRLLGQGRRADDLPDPNTDTDGDGIPDIVELGVEGLNPEVNDSGEDPDEDGLTHLEEYLAGTDYFVADTDGDGLLDGVETNTGIYVSAEDTGTDPNNADSDSDGFGDAVENNSGVNNGLDDPGTNPNLADTDGDRLKDLTEVAAGTDPFGFDKLPLLGWWPFNDIENEFEALDAVAENVGFLQNGAVYTADQGGRTGEAGDYAIDFGTTSEMQLMLIEPAAFANPGADGDQISFAFWQKLHAVAASDAFWGVTSGNGRAISVHTPWSNNIIYYDTAGCCDGARQRINANINTFSEFEGFSFLDWTHFVFSKNGPVKQIWINGTLFLEGTSTDPLPTDFLQIFLAAEPNGNNSLQGIIDDFSVYAGALEPNEIQMLAGGAAPDSLPVRTEQTGGGEDINITEASVNGVDFSLTWESEAGVTYRVEARDTLGGDWMVLGTVTADAATASYTDAGALEANDTRFYQVVQE